jgi:serine/threonine-protein kinase
MEAPPSIRVVRTNVPDQLEDAIMCALEKVPSDRFATVSQFKDAVLNGLATGTLSRLPSTRLTARTASRAAAAGHATRRRRRLAYGAAAIVVLAVGGVAAAKYYRDARDARSRHGAMSGDVDLRRLAVLYLDDRSRDSSLHDVAAGMTTSLIDQLRRVEGLQVISAEGVAPFAHADVTDDSIARALKVGLLVRGGVETQGDNLHVSLRLIDGMSGATFKTEGFNVKKGAFLTARDSLVQRVADVLRDRLGEEVHVRQLEHETKSPEAWALVQRGQNVRHDGERVAGTGDLTGAEQRYVEADSLALAAGRLDDHWAQPLIDQAWVASDRARLTKDPKAIKATIDSGLTDVAGALALDSRNPDALEMRARLTYYPVSAGLVANQHDIDETLDRAEKDLRDVVTFAPRQASAWYLLSVVEFAKKNVPEAIMAAHQAYDADAYLRSAPAILSTLWANSYNLEQFSDAIRWCSEGGQRFPTNPLFVRCRLYLMVTKAVPPDPAEAWRQVNTYEQLTPAANREYAKREGEILTSIVLYHANLADSAHHVLARAANPPATVDPRGELLALQALAHTFFGEQDTAITLLEKALTSFPEHRAGFGKVNFWWWRPLQDNPRFKTLIASGR